MLLAFAAALLLAGRPLNLGLAGLLVPASVLVAFGAMDDWRKRGADLSPALQFAVQLVAAALAVAFGIFIRDVRDPTAGGPFGGVLGLPLWAAIPLTVFWIAGMINTVNFLDGLDGLACGVSGIAALILGGVSLRLGQPDLALLCFVLAGAAAGFLPHNLYPARIFMGTSGAWFLGFMLATLAIVGGAKLATALLVVGVPVFDVALLIGLRALARQPIWRGDRRHLHHRLLDHGLSHRGTVLLYYCLAGAFGLYALVFTSNRSVGLGPKLYGLGILVVVMAAILVYLRRRKA